MTDKETTKDIVEDVDLEGELRIYELGFHILPIVAEENLGAEVSNIKEIIEKNGGLFVGEESYPKSMKLAYPISKKLNNKRTNFDTAYFGWVKFEATPEVQEAVEKGLEKVENVLRFLLIKSVRQSSMVSVTRLHKMIDTKPKKEADSPKEKISEKEVDQAIEELVVE